MRLPAAVPPAALNTCLRRTYSSSLEAVPNLDPDAQTAGLALLGTLAKGEPGSERALLGGERRTGTNDRDALDSWPGVFRDEDGRVGGFMGLSVGESASTGSRSADGR
jgi:hypothetical protein